MRPVLAHAGAADELVTTLMISAGAWVGWMAWSRLRGKGFARLPRGVAIGAIPLAVLLLGASAFVPTLFRRTPPPVSTGPRPSSTARITFEEPAPGEVVRGADLPVVLGLTGGTIVDSASTDLRPNQGHIHLWVDGALVSMTYGTLQTIDARRLDPGEHELEAEFVAADHAPFDPRVRARVPFEVQP